MATMLFLTLLVSGNAPQPVVNATGTFFALSFADPKASAKWYSEKLGLTRTMQGTPSSDNAGFIVLDGGGLIVALINRRDSVCPSRINRLDTRVRESPDPAELDGVSTTRREPVRG